MDDASRVRVSVARTDGGFRVYTEDDSDRLVVIKQMKPLGISLEEMAEILGILASSEATGTTEEAHARLSEFLEKAVHQRDKMAPNLRPVSASRVACPRTWR